MDQHDDAIHQFCSITASTPEQARFFLESSGWEVEVALQNFYEGDPQGAEHLEESEDADDDILSHRPASTPDPAPIPASAPLGPRQGVGLFPSPPNRVAADRSKDKKSVGSSRGSVRTLSDINRPSESDSDEDAQEYYTGGEKSGMMVQDPQKGNRVDAIFEQARRMGAQQAPSEPSQARPNSRSFFTGTARTLAGESTQQAGEQTGRGGQRATTQQTPDPVIRNITFWRNGFTVDDGPLRRLEDPDNAEFLRSIGKSECPKELEPSDRRTPVHVSLTRRDDDWTPPPEPRHVAFQGLGRTLGSPSLTEAGSLPVSHGASNQASKGLSVDDTQPVTSIQLRLSDGTRMVARFNHYHTVADIRRFIDAARPGHANSYQLQTMGFPPQLLSDLSQTIEAAGLANAVVIQKA